MKQIKDKIDSIRTKYHEMVDYQIGIIEKSDRKKLADIWYPLCYALGKNDIRDKIKEAANETDK